MRRIARFRGTCFSVVMLILVGAQLFNGSPALAATINELSVTCRFVSLSGKTEVNTSFVRIQVVLGSDLTHLVAQQVVTTRPRAGALYQANLDIRSAHLAEGTHLVISAGEWDGIRYLRPATIIGADCNRDGCTAAHTDAATLLTFQLFISGYINRCTLLPVLCIDSKLFGQSGSPFVSDPYRTCTFHALNPAVLE